MSLARYLPTGCALRRATAEDARHVGRLMRPADQAEIDRLWKALCDGGAPGRCGWLKDRYGVSWQVVPAAIGEMMTSKDAAKIRRMTEAMLPMSKIDVAALRNAFDGGSAA